MNMQGIMQFLRENCTKMKAIIYILWQYFWFSLDFFLAAPYNVGNNPLKSKSLWKMNTTV